MASPEMISQATAFVSKWPQCMVGLNTDVPLRIFESDDLLP